MRTCHWCDAPAVFHARAKGKAAWLACRRHVAALFCFTMDVSEKTDWEVERLR